MKRSLKNKNRTWSAVWFAGCMLVAGVMIYLVQNEVSGCSVQDITGFPTAIPTAAKTEGTEDSKQAAEKRVYLTFDDGPSETTEEILKILAEKQVPATFFVIAAPNNEKHLPLIRKEAEQGHQIALHSCSHEYSEIYQSTTAFWADIKQLREKISPYVDLDTISWLRFPGGSTNTVSHKYGGSGIMKKLKSQAEEKGYHYVDWNVCAGDAVGGHPSSAAILENVMRDAQGKNSCIVLMHDTKVTKTTAQALPDIIDWFKEQGYSFCRIEQLLQEAEKQ